jgi:hypothetical protein
VPASPELALDLDLLEVAEKEVLERGGVLAYNLSLSAKPESTVTVTVTPEIRNAICYGYPSKFELHQNVFEFTSETYNTSQTVNIVVNGLDTSNYEGVFFATFQHSIDTEDEDFKSAFLRPVSVTFQDDSVCVANATKFEDPISGTRKCGCIEGHYVVATDPLFCDSVTKCGYCPEGLNCNVDPSLHPSGQVLEEARLKGGYYRAHNSSLNVVKCPAPQTQCVGGATFGSELCALGYKGAFCMVCELGDLAKGEVRYTRSGDECLKCDGSSEAILYTTLTLLGLLMIGAVVFVSRAKKKKRGKGRKSRYNTDRVEVWLDKVQTKYKILVTFTQILSKITTLYPIRLPAMFTTFWSNFSFLSFDVSVLPMNCVLDSNFHDRLVVTTLFPMIYFCGSVVVWFILRQRLVWKWGDSVRASTLSTLTSKSISVFIIFLYTVFPGTTEEC